MGLKGIVVLIICTIIGWYLAEHLLIQSASGIVHGGSAEKAEANELMKSILWSLLIIGIIVSSVNSGTTFEIWKNVWSTNILKGMAVGISAFYLIIVPGFVGLSLLVLYSACFGAGYGFGKFTGSLLSRFVPERYRVSNKRL